jgi:vancomycin resistance protein VanW
MARRLRRELRPKLEARKQLSDGKRQVWRRRRDLGADLDLGWMMGRAQSGARYIPLRLRVDTSTLIRALRRLSPTFAATPRNARIGSISGHMKIVPERVGRSLNVGASAARVKAQIEKNAADRQLQVVARTQSPRVTRQSFKGITGQLASFTTRFNPGKVKRTHNMQIAIRTINGTLVKPGAVFSLNKTVGERTQKRGYRTSIVFLNGYKVPGIGAGVSQVTGTLFNAALLAGLPIVEYRTHSRPVTYIPVGRDATVAWGSFDMKWKNNTPAPIYINYQISGNHATATLFGKRIPGQRVSLRVIARNLGPRRKTAQLFRTIRHGAKIVRKEKVGTSNYNWKEGDWEQ